MSANGEDVGGKKVRGRPRVDPQDDETAADVSIRLHNNLLAHRSEEETATQVRRICNAKHADGTSLFLRIIIPT